MEKVPKVISFRPTPDDKTLISWLVKRLNPRDLSKLIRAGLQCLKEKEGQNK